MHNGAREIRKEVVEEMRQLWNTLDGEHRKALADLMSYTHADYMCTKIEEVMRCRRKRKEKE